MREQVKNLVRPPLAEAIYKLRKSRSRTQIEVSKELGVHQSAIVRWERGIDMPPTKILLMLSEMAPKTEKLWWRDQASARVGFDLERPESAIERKESETLDPELMTEVIEAIQAARFELGYILPPKIYAAILVQVYNRWKWTQEHDCSFVKKLVRRSRVKTNRKVSK